MTTKFAIGFGILAVLLFLVYSALSQTSAPAAGTPTVKATFQVTETPDERLLKLGTATLAMGVGGFGAITYTSADGAIRITRPVYPRGHVLSSAEAEEEQNFRWPDNMTADFFKFMALKRMELLGY